MRLPSIWIIFLANFNESFNKNLPFLQIAQSRQFYAVFACLTPNHMARNQLMQFFDPHLFNYEI